MSLFETVEPMLSVDYKERFRAEYMQTKYRYDKLHSMVVRYEAGTLDFKPTCSIELLKQQKSAMGRYLYCLEVRAQVEHIKL
ncbi:MAG: crAss001_48 related protein [Aristaeellaceae bacterium]